MLTVPPPTPEELASLRSLHAHRFPQAGSIRLPAANGGTVSIPLVIGLPSGACRMPSGAVVSPAWEQFVESAIKRSPEPDGFRETLAQDVVLYPSPGVLAQVLEEWPAAPVPIGTAVMKKIGREALEVPTATEQPPASLAPLLIDRAVWRKVKASKADEFAIVIVPPSSAAWSIFSDGIRRTGANSWKMSTEIVQACVPAVCRADGVAANLEEVACRYPGLVLSIVGTIAMISGGAAEVELGE